MQGTSGFPPQMRLATDNDVRALATALDIPRDRPEIVRRQALAKVATARDTSTADASPLAALQSAGFLTYEAPPPPPTTTTSTSLTGPSPSTTTTLLPSLTSLPLARTRYLVLSGAGA